MRDDAEFDEFVRARYARLCRVAYLLCGDHAHAEDLVQTALAKTFEAGRRRPIDNLDAYARQAVLSTFLTWRRRRWHGETPAAVLPERPGADESEAADRRQMLLAAIGRLPAAQRATVVLRYLEDLSEEETARLLGCSPGTVKSRLNRAIASLRAAGVDAAAEPAGTGAIG